MRTMLHLDDTPGTGELWRGNTKLPHQCQNISRDLHGETILMQPGARAFAYTLTDAQVQARHEGGPFLPYRFIVYSPGNAALNWTAFYTEAELRAFADAYALTIHGDISPGSRFEIELPTTSAEWQPVTRRLDGTTGRAQNNRNTGQPWAPLTDVDIWVLRHEHKHGNDVTLHSNHDAGLAALARIVCAQWDNITDNPDVPPTPRQLSDEDAVAVYFAHRCDVEMYSLTSMAVHARGSLLAGVDPAVIESLVRLAVTVETESGTEPDPGTAYGRALASFTDPDEIRAHARSLAFALDLA